MIRAADRDNCLISEYPWGMAYRPEAFGRLHYQAGAGFAVLMRCYEAPARRRAVHQKPDAPVFEDSCLEFFVNFNPGQSENYFNFEVNPLGCMLAGFGRGRANRSLILAKGGRQPVVKINDNADYWEIEYLIPLSLIEHFYGKIPFEPGTQIKGNFYKCGDCTQIPHYGSWSAIKSERPDFHRPEYFGEFIIGEDGTDKK